MNTVHWYLIGIMMPALLGAQTIPMQPSSFDTVNTVIEAVSYNGHPAVRLIEGRDNQESIAIVRGLQMQDGDISVMLAGRVRPNANPAARGFIGIAFRVLRDDSIRYDCFYLRPANGRVDDQFRRNHTTQYIAHPRYPWYRLRKDFPGVYESYVDMGEGEWTKVRIEVRGTTARLFVHDAAQPALIVNGLLNPVANGAVALWIGQGTEAFFRDLTVTRR